MRSGHASIIPAKERQKILREITLVGVRQRSHDAEVERDVFAPVRWLGRDEDVARMHVGVEKAVAKDLGKEDLHAEASESLEIDRVVLEAIHLADGRALHALHDHDFAVAPVPIDFWHAQQRRVQKVAP